MSNKVNNHFQLSDEDFLRAFTQSEIEEDLFNHEAHLRVCWLLLQKYPLLTALQKVTSGLKKLVAKLGAVGKYHETVTVALTLLMYERMGNEPDFRSFIGKSHDLIANWRGLLGAHYSEGCLWSAEARKAFVQGDLG